MKKKGFTLIELLAIIVILAIIALIAVPVVLNIIDKAKVSSYARSSENILAAARLYYNESKLDKTMSLSGDQYNAIISTISGAAPDDGKIYIERKGNISMALKYGSYCYRKSFTEDSFTTIKLGPDDTCELSSVDKLKTNLAADGVAGLYLDSDGVYRYKGNNPDNIILLGDETYRILSIEEQGIKVVRMFVANELKSAWDIGNRGYDICDEDTCPRNNSSNTYCQVTSGMYYGCNIWSKASEIIGTGVNGDTVAVGDHNGTVTQNSTIYDYLHNTYYEEKLSSISNNIVQNAKWNIGSVDYYIDLSSSISLDALKKQESKWKWHGKIGLPNVSDFIQAQLPGTTSYLPEDAAGCVDCFWNFAPDNWMASGGEYWTINLSHNNNEDMGLTSPVISILSDFADGFGIVGVTSYTEPWSQLEIRPVVYLNLNIELSGSGTEMIPYEIVES